jgi:hypothetical protein
MEKKLFNYNLKKMKKTLFTYFIGILLLSLGMTGCSKDEINGPSVKGYLNGTEVKEIKVTLGTTVNFKYDIQSSAKLSKVEVFVRKGIGLNTDSQLFLRKEAVTGDLDGNTYTVQGSLVATTDLMISVGALDSEGRITVLQLNALLEVSEFDDLVLMDAMENGTSKSFCNSQYGLLLFAANTAADPAAIDFGFFYMESNANVKASLVSFSDYAKTASYPVVGTNNATLFKKALGYTNADANSVQQMFASGTDFPSVLGIEAGKVAPNLKDGDVVAFKTQKGKYGLILVKTIDRKSEANSNQQTIKIKMVVQK